MVRIKNFFKSAGRYLKSILPAFLFFTTLLFTYSTPVFASSSGGLVTEKPTADTLPKSQQYSLKYYKELFDDLVNTIDENNRRVQKIVFLNRLYYFSLMLDNSLNCSYDISSKNYFTNDYLWYYFDFYVSHVHWSDNTSLAFFTVANDDGIITNVDDLKFDIENLSFFPSSWNGRLLHWSLSDPPDYFDNFKNFYNYLYNVYVSDGSLLPGELSGIADLNFSIPDFNGLVQTGNKFYYPKNATGKMSYRTDEHFHNCYDSWSSPLEYCMLDFYAGDFGFSATGDKKEMYFVFFEKLGDSSFYGQYQFHCTIIAEDIYYEDRDEVEHTNYTLNFECWDNIDGSQSNPTSLASITKTSPYFVLALNSSRPELYNYSSYSNYISANVSSWNTLLTDYNLIRSLWKPDLSTSIRFSYSDQKHFKGPLSSHNSSCSYNGSCDFGYLASSAPISTLYNIDTTRIPENYYITVSGDTIYDYSITNPETGQKDTIQNFITNNYTFNNGDTNIDTGDHNTSIGGSGSGNGGGGGDVNVNVTVNNNIGGGDGGSYDMPDTSFFDDYLDDALEESTGIRKFIKDFFNSVPGEITKLICTGLVLAILCRLIGR